MDPSLIQIVCVDDDTSVTIGELDALANQVSHWALKAGIKNRYTLTLLAVMLFLAVKSSTLIALWCIYVLRG